MNLFRSIGAWLVVAGTLTTCAGAWLGIYAVVSSNYRWLTSLWVGLLLTLCGGVMLSLAWAHDREAAKEAAADEFTAARLKAIHEEEARKLIEQLFSGGFEGGEFNVSDDADG